MFAFFVVVLLSFFSCFHQFTETFFNLMMLFTTQKFCDVYALCQSLCQQHCSHKFDILCNLILRLTGSRFPNCFPLEQREFVLDQLKEKVIGASSEDKEWLISVLNKHAEIPEFKNDTVFLLGWCYQNGVGVVKDYKEAVRLFSLAAQQGNSGAQFNLGVCYQNGVGVVKDDKEAVRLYSLAAQQGHSDAQNNLGLCYRNGVGVDIDDKEAVRLFSLAAQQGNSRAQFNLGLCYENGDEVVKDAKEAVRLFSLAAQQGNSDAQYNLGLCYRNGVGVDVDDKKAALARRHKFLGLWVVNMY